MGIQLWIDGMPSQMIAPVKFGDLSYSTAADGGCQTAQWKMPLPRTFRHPSLTIGKLVAIRLGSLNLFLGKLSRPDPGDDDGWSFTAQGLDKDADYALCFDGALNTTATPDTAIDQAIARGALSWIRSTSISSTPFTATDSTGDLNYVSELMNAYAGSNGQRWGVDASGQIYCRADRTVPTYYLTPDVGRVGLADDEFATTIYGRYQPSGAGLATVSVDDPIARAQFGRREYRADLTTQGLINSTQATASLNGMLALGKARQGATDGVDATEWQLTTPGGQPAFLPLVKGGELVRQFGTLSDQGQPFAYVDWIIGETDYDAGAKNIGLTPVGMAPRSLGDVIAGTGDAA